MFASQHGKYKGLDDMCTDLELVFQNAFQYNLSTSQLYKDAEILHKAMQHKKRELEKLERSSDKREKVEKVERLERVHVETPKGRGLHHAAESRIEKVG